jgi:hypothetical protein
MIEPELIAGRIKWYRIDRLFGFIVRDDDGTERTPFAANTLSSGLPTASKDQRRAA